MTRQYHSETLHLYITSSSNTPDHSKGLNFTVSALGHLGIIIPVLEMKRFTKLLGLQGAPQMTLP